MFDATIVNSDREKSVSVTNRPNSSQAPSVRSNADVESTRSTVRVVVTLPGGPGAERYPRYVQV